MSNSTRGRGPDIGLYVKNNSTNWAEIVCEHISRWVLLTIKLLSQKIDSLEFCEPPNIGKYQILGPFGTVKFLLERETFDQKRRYSIGIFYSEIFICISDFIYFV